MRKFLIIATLFVGCEALVASETDYSDGVFIVNEDWYGHQNSTVNFLRPDDPEGNYWEYRIFKNANPGNELGCTNQFGAIHEGRFYFIAKQERDPGATVTGGRITVADARTMEMLYQSAVIDPSGNQCDGRAFVGYDSHKGYISTSHGVWGFDLDKYEITGMVKGTENPHGYSDGGNINASGSLYHGQCGMMVVAEGKVFVAHQDYGLLVVDPSTDTVEKTFTIPDKVGVEGAGIGSVVKAKDGSLWLSVTKTLDGLGEMLPYLICVDPATLEYSVVDVPDGFYPPASSWYAWTPDAFCASAQKNTIYWNGGENSWFSTNQIFRYDIDRNEFTKIIDFEEENPSDPWKLYGCSMRVHPETDELYMSLFHEFGATIYITRRCDADGNTIRDYAMIENYWFPSLPVFPVKENESSVEAAVVDAVGISVGADASIAVCGGVGQALMIYNMQGMLVRSYQICNEFSVISTNLAAGAYIARISNRIIKFAI